jgi:hypothetical protein
MLSSANWVSLSSNYAVKQVKDTDKFLISEQMLIRIYTTCQRSCVQLRHTQVSAFEDRTAQTFCYVIIYRAATSAIKQNWKYHILYIQGNHSN